MDDHGEPGSIVTPFVPTEQDVVDTTISDSDRPTQYTNSLVGRCVQFQDSCSSPCPINASPPSSRVSPGPDVLHRDSQFYMADGSCVLRVGNTLFNVHRSILSADSSSFGTLFTLPQGDITIEGTSDDNPIVLHGDTPEEFRSFLWSLYALPHEITVVRGPHIDLNRFIDIAKVANKYSFKSIETWALDVIQEFIERKPSPLLDIIPVGFPFPTNSSPSAFVESKRRITRLVQLAQMCGHVNLLETMIALLRQLMSASLHFSYLAMCLADDLDLRELRGSAYLEVLQRSAFICGRDKHGNVLVEGDIHERPVGSDCLVVSPIQQLRLLSGYLRLSKAWENLRGIPIPFEHAPACENWNRRCCTQSWSEFWEVTTRANGVLALGAANVIGKLQVMLTEFDKWGSATYMYHECKSVARQAIQGKIKYINDLLPEFFHETGEY